MLLTELLEAFLDEDIQMRDTTHLGAFAVTVTEVYDALVDQRVVPLWKE